MNNTDKKIQEVIENETFQKMLEEGKLRDMCCFLEGYFQDYPELKKLFQLMNDSHMKRLLSEL